MDRILLIDGLNAVWRANVAFKSSTDNKDDLSFVIVYNFFRHLRATIEDLQPSKVFFCLEGKDNFRYKLYSDYKANRIIKTSSVDEKSMDEFHRQKRIIIQLLHSLPITIVHADQYECDDVIATLTDNLKDEEVIILSNDSDFIQLLQKGYKHLRIYNPFKKEYMSAPSYHYLTWKCLRGDKKTDNIPGLMGDKAAEKLAKDADKFMQFLESPEVRADYSLNKKLIELRIIPDDELKFADYKIDYNILKEQFEKMDFKSILEEKYWYRFRETFSSLR